MRVSTVTVVAIGQVPLAAAYVCGRWGRVVYVAGDSEGSDRGVPSGAGSYAGAWQSIVTEAKGRQ